MGEIASLVLSYALWPMLALALVGLWLAATMDIVRHRRGGVFSDAKLLGMAAAVSVVAVIALVGAGATLGGGWAEAVSATPDETGAVQGVPARSYIFSFGLEHASSPTPADATGEERQAPHQAPHD
ncbi:MAG TPA: hypothetical protein VKA73_10645 [Rubrobacter sp.]|nr:hypothetical protein [Rubrobacter sp.]